MDSPGRLDSVLDDCDFLLQLAEESAQEKLASCPSPRSQMIKAASQGQRPVHVNAAASRATVPVATAIHSNSKLQPSVHPLPSSVPSANGFYVEQLSGLKVCKPIIGSLIVKERLSYRSFVKLAAVKSIMGTPASDWATLAVVASKTQQEGKNGNVYSRWQLSDLEDGNITLFLFGDAHKALYKESEGSVVILFHAKFSRDKGGNGVSLSVDKEEQVCKIGMSPDLAYCKGVKPDGTPCRHIVNRSKCEYCPYHAARALKQLQCSRPDLRGRSMLESQLRPVALKAEQYTRRAAARPPPTVLSGQRLADVATSLRNSAGASGRVQVSGKRNRGMNAVLAVASADMQDKAAAGPNSKLQKPGSLATSKHSAGNATRPNNAQKESQGEEQYMVMDDSDDEQKRASKPMTAAQARLLAAVQANKAAAATGSHTHEHTLPGGENTLCTTTATGHDQRDSQPHTLQGNASEASNSVRHAQQHRMQQGGMSNPLQVNSHLNAAYLSQQHKTLRGLQPNSSQHNVTANPANKSDPATKAKAKMLHNLGLATKKAGSSSQSVPCPFNSLPKQQHGGTKQATQTVSSQPRVVSALAAAFGDVVAEALQDEESAKSRYHELGEDAAWDDVMTKLGDLEKRDALVQQLDSVKSLKVSAWHCADCDAITEYRSKDCTGHKVTKVQTTKRFFLCSHCNAHISSLGCIYPKRRCPRCNDPGMEFKPTTMYRGPKGTAPAAQGSGIAAKENMLARGTEHTFSLR